MKTQLKILNKNEKQEILSKLKKQFGIKELKGIFTMRGAERLFIYQGNLTEKQINEFEKNFIPLERTGIYFGKIQNNEIRLSIDAVEILKQQITKNIFEINKEQLDDWMHGRELNIETNLRGFIVIKYKDYWLGTGKASENKITNFIPKTRRLKERN